LLWRTTARERCGCGNLQPPTRGACHEWPLAARAQQPSMPMIWFLNPTSPDAIADLLRAFRQGLKDTGYLEGENVAIEYRWADNQLDRLPELAAELVRRRVAVIVTIGGPPAAFAAKVATTTIPIVFLVGEDPARLGLVASLARPGDNLTGVNFFNTELAAKRLELLRELLPTAKRVAVLVNPAEATNTESVVRDAEEAAHAMALQIEVVNASTSREIDAAFATIVRVRPDALFVGPGPFYTARRVQIALLAAIHRVPAIYPGRQYVEAGALMSYGASLADSCRQVGICRPHSQGCQASRPAGGAVEQIRAGHQSPDCQVARPHRAAYAAQRCRRRDRVSLQFAAPAQVSSWHAAAKISAAVCPQLAKAAPHPGSICWSMDRTPLRAGRTWGP
jgi:putative tryptophan/tyrosine transport system substrate-binding protein